MEELLWKETETLLSLIVPSPKSVAGRDILTEHVRNIICKTRDGSLLLLSGSCCSRTFLPDGDVDLVLLTSMVEGTVVEAKELSSVFAALCEDIYRRDMDHRNQYQHDLVIRNVEFINARTKLLHCIVGSSSVDITVNQVGVVASLLFIDEVDKAIGLQHLFKQSVMLIKVYLFSFIFFDCDI